MSTTRTITVACQTTNAILPVIWGAVEGSDHSAARADAAQYLTERPDVSPSSDELWTVEIEWSGALPDGENRRARELAETARRAGTNG